MLFCVPWKQLTASSWLDIKQRWKLIRAFFSLDFLNKQKHNPVLYAPQECLKVSMRYSRYYKGRSNTDSK